MIFVFFSAKRGWKWSKYSFFFLSSCYVMKFPASWIAFLSFYFFCWNCTKYSCLWSLYAMCSKNFKFLMGWHIWQHMNVSSIFCSTYSCIKSNWNMCVRSYIYCGYTLIGWESSWWIIKQSVFCIFKHTHTHTHIHWANAKSEIFTAWHKAWHLKLEFMTLIKMRLKCKICLLVCLIHFENFLYFCVGVTPY